MGGTAKSILESCRLSSGAAGAKLIGVGKMSWEPYANANRRIGVFEKLISMKTSHLVLLPLIISLAPILILMLIGSDGYHGTPLQLTFAGLIFFLWGAAGLPIMIRREVPWFPSMNGWMAIAEGLIILTIGWGIASGFVILVLKSLF